MPDLRDGESTTMKGSAKEPYVLKNTGGVYSCNCPAWRNQSDPIERRTCKHLKKLRGEQLEAERCGQPAPEPSDGEETPAKDVPQILLANHWDGEMDPTGWWMSEKLDGVRGYWNGGMFISRLGNKIHAPDWYIKGMPTIPVDGELWVKRGFFHETNGMVRRQDKNEEIWKQIRYVSFDLPGQVDDFFEERMTHLDNLTEACGLCWFVMLAQERCEGLAHLKQALKEVEAKGGEGLMLRQPKSLYDIGKSNTLLKVKNFIDDEARILGYNKGSGKNKGMVGSYACELRSGAKFDVNAGTNKLRRDPPPIGSIITVHYKELTKDGIPREPTFHGVRIDAKPWGKKKV